MKKNTLHHIAAFATFALLIAMTLGCNTPPDKKYCKDGRQYGVVKGLFRDRWWNFYERGRSFSDGEFWQEAVSDFKMALKLRNTEQRRARTYGMHFIDYFPHRELGVALYHTGKYDEAEDELKLSLTRVETARAKYYLNITRKALLQLKNTDSETPSLHITSPRTGLVTNAFSVRVEGEAVDDTFVSSVSINDSLLFTELASKTMPFAKELPLKNGRNTITVTAQDLSGKTAETVLSVMQDTQGPMVVFSLPGKIHHVSQKMVKLSGMVADETGVASLIVDGKRVLFNSKRKASFQHTLLLQNGANIISFQAEDLAGNHTCGQVQITYNPSSKSAHSEISLHPWHHNMKKVRLAFSGDTGIADIGSLFLCGIKEDRQTPSITITLHDLTDSQQVYYDRLFIDGSVSATNTINSITINNSPLFIMPGKVIFFNQSASLKEGKNIFTIEARDTRGNKAVKTFSVFRIVPKVKQIGSRMSLAIMPFAIKGLRSPLSDIVYDNLLRAFSVQHRFNIVSRGDELEAVLRELKLNKTALVDRHHAVTLGRLVAAEAILMGTVHETKNSLEIYARLINTETSTIMEAKDVYTQDKTLAQLQFLTNGLALKFKHSFPLLDGFVIKVDGKNIYTDFGAHQHIKSQMKFIIYRDGTPIIHPVTGKNLGSDTQHLGEARIETVFEEMSIGKITAQVSADAIKVKDRVITK